MQDLNDLFNRLQEFLKMGEVSRAEYDAFIQIGLEILENKGLSWNKEREKIYDTKEKFVLAMIPNITKTAGKTLNIK